jgi:CDP-paratose 2-epimerase
MKVLITGGAGFIGSNYAARLIERGEDVVIYDNLSRGGAHKNLEWLQEKFGEKSFRLVIGDVRDASLLTAEVGQTECVVHLAAQVAVTTSVMHPREDFEINALGTFNVVEAARLSGSQPILLYASTNKVYGGMDDTPVLERESRWTYANLPHGVPEGQQLDFHSPYGCSKGAGDQYVRDYHRIYGLPSVVFRQGCIYGPRQFGIEDQGWVAWFVIATVLGRPIKIFGDGKQVRDMLHVEDLMDAYDAAVNQIDTAAGHVYNIGGGADNTLSIWAEFGSILSDLHGSVIPVAYEEWRPGDQRVNISDTRFLMQKLGWKPKIHVRKGIEMLYDWVAANRELFG